MNNPPPILAERLCIGHLQGHKVLDSARNLVRYVALKLKKPSSLDSPRICLGQRGGRIFNQLLSSVNPVISVETLDPAA